MKEKISKLDSTRRYVRADALDTLYRLLPNGNDYEWMMLEMTERAEKAWKEFYSEKADCAFDAEDADAAVMKFKERLPFHGMRRMEPDEKSLVFRAFVLGIEECKRTIIGNLKE